MTTKSQVKKLLKPILTRHEDLHLGGRALVIRPIRHVLREVVFVATSSSDWFQPYWLVTHICQTTGTSTRQWSKEIFSLNYRSWTWSDPLMPNEFCGILESQILPMLRPLDTLEAMVNLARDQKPELSIPECHPLANLSLAIAFGELDAAKRMLAVLEAGNNWLWELPENRQATAFLAAALRDKLEAGDRAGLAAQLHTWEAERVARLGLQDIWQPSPFPIELGGVGGREDAAR